MHNCGKPHAHAHHQMTAPAGQGHNRRRRRRPLDSSLAVAAVGALSATLALAFTTPLAPHTHHHDRCHTGGGVPSNSCFRPRQQPQGHACCMGHREACLRPRESGLSGSGSGSRRRTRQQQAASCLSFGAGPAARGAVGGATSTSTSTDAAGSAGNRPVWHLYASTQKEAAVVEQEGLEGEEGGGAGTDAAQQHRDGGGGDAAADADSSPAAAAAAGAEEGAPKKRKRRRPPAYWSSDDNLRDEVAKFWAELGIASDKVQSISLTCVGACSAAPPTPRVRTCMCIQDCRQFGTASDVVTLLLSASAGDTSDAEISQTAVTLFVHRMYPNVLLQSLRLKQRGCGWPLSRC